jgi:cyclopropane fatty-acyl-phospholipid synthase-like methyltransferase
MTPTHDAPLTPEPIMQALTGFWVSGALKGAIELGLFAKLATGPLGAVDLGAAIGAPERTTRILADALAALGFLSRGDDGRYANAPVADAFLDPAKPSYFGAMTNILASPIHWPAFGKVAEAVRAGGSVLEKNGLAPDHEFWTTFARSSLALAGHQGALLAGELEASGLRRGARILDLACGTGAYGFSIAARDPAARVTCVDWPSVLPETRRVAERFGVADRASFVGGDVFEADLGAGYDVVLLTNIYHHFDIATCERLTRRAHDALAPGGIAAIVEFVPDDERRRAVLPLMFSVCMMLWTPRGDAYTAAQYRTMLEGAGFTGVELRQPQGMAQTFVLARRKS